MADEREAGRAEPEGRRGGANTATNYNSVNLTDTVGVMVLGAVALILAIALLLAVRRMRSE